MTTYSFDILVSELPNDDLMAWSDALFEAGCDDSSPGVHCGAPYVHFDREAASLEQAIKSAASQVQTTGVEVLKVELSTESLAELTAH